MIAWRIEIPNWHPVRINVWAGRHWRAKARLMNAQTAQILVYARIAGVPDATGPRRVSLELMGWRRGGNYPDADAFRQAPARCAGALPDARRRQRPWRGRPREGGVCTWRKTHCHRAGGRRRCLT